MLMRGWLSIPMMPSYCHPTTRWQMVGKAPASRWKTCCHCLLCQSRGSQRTLQLLTPVTLPISQGPIQLHLRALTADLSATKASCSKSGRSSRMGNGYAAPTFGIRTCRHYPHRRELKGMHMNSKMQLLLAVVGGVVIGAFGVGLAWAKAKPPA